MAYIGTAAVDESLFATAAALADHEDATINVHGIADTSRLVTIDNFADYDAPAPDLSSYATIAALTTTTNTVTAHVSATTGVHGIADTSRLITRDNIATYAPPPDLSGYATTASLAGYATTASLASAQSSFTAGLATAEKIANKGQPGGYAPLDASGLIPNSALPPLAITDTFAVSSQAAQDALTVQRGDVVIRTDLSRSYIFDGTTFKELLGPQSPVVSVNGQTGAVNLLASDVHALAESTPVIVEGDARLTNARAPTAHTHPIADVTGLQAALDARVLTSDSRLTDARTPLAHTHLIADVTGLQAALDARVLSTDARLSDARTPLAHVHVIADVTGLQAALDDKPGSGVSNTVSNKVLVRPADGQNGVVVKVPDLTPWGEDTGAYGTNQAFMVLKEDTTGAVEPDDLVMFRVNGKGAIGVGGGAHYATGLRGRPGDTYPYSIHVNPTYDCTGIFVDSAVNAPTSPYQQWRQRDSSVIPNTTVVVAEVNAAGQLRANRTAFFTAGDTTSVPVTAQQFAGSTAHQAEYRDSNGTIQTWVGPAGNLVATTFVQANTATGTYTVYNGTSVVSNARAATDLVHIVKGVAAQSGDLLQAQSSASAVLAGVSAAGQGFFGMASAASNNQFATQAGAPTRSAMIARAAASQSANILEIQDSTGTVKSSFDASGGYLTTTNGVLTPAVAEAAATGAFLTLSATGVNSGSVVANARAAGNVPFAVKMAASPTVNAFEVRDSANAVKMKIRNDGTPTPVQLGVGDTFPSASVQGQATAAASGTVAWVARGASGQSVDISQVRDNTDVVLARFNTKGQLGIKAAAAPGALAGYGYIYVDAGGALRYRGPTTDTQLAIA